MASYFFINSFISYVLSDQVWCNVKQFLSYSKSYICKFMQANSWHKLFHFDLHFWIWKVWKEREKLRKFGHLENKKSFFYEINNIFDNFWKAIIWWKNKNLIKNSGRQLFMIYHPRKILYQQNENKVLFCKNLLILCRTQSCCDYHLINLLGFKSLVKFCRRQYNVTCSRKDN